MEWESDGILRSEIQEITLVDDDQVDFTIPEESFSHTTANFWEELMFSSVRIENSGNGYAEDIPKVRVMQRDENTNEVQVLYENYVPLRNADQGLSNFRFRMNAPLVWVNIWILDRSKILMTVRE